MQVNFKKHVIFLGLLLLFVLLISLMDFASKAAVPYNSVSTFSKNYKYENFENINDEKKENEKNSIDVFSNLNGSPNCEPSPYSNSMGYLCMENKEKELLKTRGYNQT